MSFLIENGLLLTPDDVLLFAWWTETSLPHMQARHAIDGSMIERARMLRRAADRYLAMSQLRHELAQVLSAEESSALSIGLPEALTAREAAKVIGVDRRTIYRIKAQLGVLRERPLMLSRDVVVRYKIGHPEERSTAA